MSPKIKVFLIYGIAFIVTLLLIRFLMLWLFQLPDFYISIIPFLGAAIFLPRPYLEKINERNRYGLKCLFLKKVYWL
jgi:hypothetical protein